MLKLAIRTTDVVRLTHPGLSSFLNFNVSSDTPGYDITRDLEVISFNENLDVESKFKPAISNGTMINWAFNNHGDLFIAWFNAPTIEVIKYNEGKTEPFNKMTADVDFKPKSSFKISEATKLLPSNTNFNIFYCGLTYPDRDKNQVIAIGKFDFATNTKNYETEVLNKSHIKELEKQNKVFNKKIKEIDLGYHQYLELKGMAEVNGMLMTFVMGDAAQNFEGIIRQYASPYLITSYKPDLTHAAEFILPSYCQNPYKEFGIALHPFKEKLYLTKNSKDGVVYAILNTTNWQWEKMEYLSDKHLADRDFAATSCVMWFNDTFIVTYKRISWVTNGNLRISLQLNQY